ncbi:MAG: radical SAM protein, partial [Candidatus Rokubacteria bacterium]|nr:radical SAM protein [Candidatus Rokubacteria bacterium]
MSWDLRKKAQALLALEEGGIVKDWGGKISVALVYPNTYAVGMSNLGFQTVYAYLNRLPDVVCERVFFPDPEDLDEYLRTRTVPSSLETQRPLSDFHLVGFSVTYEGDYINVLRLLSMAGIPLYPEARRPQDPLILMGGVCAFANPEPVAPFMDFVVVGEGEEIVGEIVAAYREAFEGVDPARRRRDAFLDRLAPIQGIYLPHAYQVRHAGDGTIAAVEREREDVPQIVVKRRLKDVNQFETISLLKTPRAEYGHMSLLEVGKGCGRGCRFCLEGEIYRPVRHRSLDSLRATVAKIAKDGKRVGLVGACVSDYPWIGDLMKILEEHGVEVSISSLRADSLTEELVASLKRGGHRTLTMAPEAGTER